MRIPSQQGWGCVKRFLPPSAAEFSFETDVFFMILLRKIMKNTSVSNFNLARSAEKILFTQPPGRDVKFPLQAGNGNLIRQTPHAIKNKKCFLFINKMYIFEANLPPAYYEIRKKNK
jgi:hypothetical protein